MNRSLTFGELERNRQNNVLLWFNKWKLFFFFNNDNNKYFKTDPWLRYVLFLFLNTFVRLSVSVSLPWVCLRLHPPPLWACSNTMHKFRTNFTPHCLGSALQIPPDSRTQNPTRLSTCLSAPDQKTEYSFLNAPFYTDLIELLIISKNLYGAGKFSWAMA